MKHVGIFIAGLVTLGLLTGCGSTPKNGPEGGAPGSELSGPGGAGGAGGAGGLGRMGGGESDLERGGAGGAGGGMDGAGGFGGRGGAGGEPEHRVYFDFNSASINAESTRTLTTNAQWIKSRSPKEVVIEGHCDERGTREYNLALGQKRADAVKQFLSSQGVDWYRIRTVSYGKERPLVYGHDEFAWAKNRRAELRAQ
ncbi:MAG: peptidoglycan-associated lipoprotein Pal [Magnetococcales bacterium]|nr:peptidoglycan-associated lipoprotein Pal [Magnetococcales bacterium]